MNRKRLFLLTAMAFVIYLVPSSNAFAFSDPQCSENGRSNDVRLYGVSIKTSSSKSRRVAGLTGKGLVCGTDVRRDGNDQDRECDGVDTIYDHATIRTPPGVRVNPAPSNTIPAGSYVGSSTVDVVLCSSGTPIELNSEALDPAALTAEDTRRCEAENNRLIGNRPQGSVVSCFKGTVDQRGIGEIGYNLNWTIQDRNGSVSLIIGPFHPVIGTVAGLTEIDEFSLCKYAGAVGGNSCGSPATGKWLQKNGYASVGSKYLFCLLDGIYSPIGDSNGNPLRGEYIVTATNRGGITTPPRRSCSYWSYSFF